MQLILREFPPLSFKYQIQICFITINKGQNCACLPERTLGKSWSIWRQSVRSHPRQGWRRTACMWCLAGAEEPVWPLLLSCEIQRSRDYNTETRLINKKSHVLFSVFCFDVFCFLTAVKICSLIFRFLLAVNPLCANHRHANNIACHYSWFVNSGDVFLRSEIFVFSQRLLIL